MKRKIRLFYLIGTLDMGGAEGQLVELVTRLDRHRFAPVVCCLSSGGAYAEALAAAGIPVEVIGFRGFRIFRHPHKVAAQMFRLVRAMRRAQPDVVHGFLFWAYILGAFAAWMARVPVVLSSRRSLGHFKANKPHYLALERLTNRMTDLVIANSEAVRQDAIREERLPAERVMVIHNGLDLDRHGAPPDEGLRRSLGLERQGPVVGVVANFIHYKGHQFFLDAWAAAVKKFPESVALLVGDGPLRQEFEARVHAMGLGPSVRFLGTHQDVPALVALMDLVVHPSLEEGFSNAILEAMAAGKPVVATAVGGNPEAVIHGKTGLLVPPGDSQALADAMLWLLAHPREAVRFGEAGRLRVAERFEISAMVRQYEAVYERLVAEKCPERVRAEFSAGRTIP
jgi:glycosyltransferase involved in cell wall biosynthesis